MPSTSASSPSSPPEPTGQVLLGPGHEARAAELLRWFGHQSRDLPWRRTRDPWAVLVAELMLQQTQVPRVIDPWHRFLDRWPTPTACAAARTGEVVEAWQGLGYNRRAVNLHRCAQKVVQVHGGSVPDDLDRLLDLPGIGPYTARAVLAFAFEQDVGVVDTNAARVLARWTGRPLRPREAQDAADRAVPPGEGWTWNQAVLDLGATVCRARRTDCGSCPVTSRCTWHLRSQPHPDPARGTAGASSPQPAFAGSDREGRGRLVDALRTGPVSDDALAEVMGWPQDPDRARRVAARVVADGLADHRGGALRLP